MYKDVIYIRDLNLPEMINGKKKIIFGDSNVKLSNTLASPQFIAKILTLGCLEAKKSIFCKQNSIEFNFVIELSKKFKFLLKCKENTKEYIIRVIGFDRSPNSYENLPSVCLNCPYEYNEGFQLIYKRFISRIAEVTNIRTKVLIPNMLINSMLRKNIDISVVAKAIEISYNTIVNLKKGMCEENIKESSLAINFKNILIVGKLKDNYVIHHIYSDKTENINEILLKNKNCTISFDDDFELI